MASPVGTQTLNSLSQRYLINQVVDNVYGNVLMFYRLNSMNKKRIQGGTQIEIPLNYAAFTNGGEYQGFQVLDIAPQDTVKNAAWDWKQYYTAVSVDTLTLIKADSPEAAVNFLTYLFENAQTDLVNKLAVDTWSDGSNSLKLDGLQGAVDDSDVLVTYGGLSRTTNTWWKAADDSSTTVLTLTSMRSAISSGTSGGRTATIAVGTKANYNRFWVLMNAKQTQFTQTAGGIDENLAQNGFRNLLFDGIPFCIDDNVPANHIFYLNEDYIYLYVANRADFSMKEFREPVNQDAMSSLITWAGNIIITNCARQSKQSALTS